MLVWEVTKAVNQPLCHLLVVSWRWVVFFMKDSVVRWIHLSVKSSPLALILRSIENKDTVEKRVLGIKIHGASLFDIREVGEDLDVELVRGLWHV